MTDSGIAALSRLAALRTLHLGARQRVTARGMRLLSRLPALRELTVGEALAASDMRLPPRVRINIDYNLYKEVGMNDAAKLLLPCVGRSGESFVAVIGRDEY